MVHFVTTLSLIAAVFAFNTDKRCLLFDHKCISHCPRNMFAYHTRCDGKTKSQRTCDNPFIYIIGYTCGWSRCDCSGDLVLDEQSAYCVPLENCPAVPTKLPRPKTATERRGRGRLSKRIKFKEDEISELMYTGHCPLLKFRYGKCYGDNTRQILKEIRTKGLFNKPLKYRPGDRYELDRMPRRDASRGYDLPHRDGHMTGYTGYVPGMHFTYGKSYGRAADDCMADFTANQRDLRRRSDFNRSYIRSRSAPKMETVHSRDEIRRDLNRFIEINKYKDNTISPEFPPIAGYTGHIPRIKGSEASLSQRYHCAAKRGLELIRIERDRRHQLHTADDDVKAVLRDRKSYCNWG